MIHVLKFAIAFILLVLALPLQIGLWIATLIFWRKFYFEFSLNITEKILTDLNPNY